MGFCTFCGRQVADGEVCQCQQNVAVQQNAYATPQPEYVAPQQETVAVEETVKVSGEGLFAPIIEQAKDTIENPLDAGSNFYKKANMKTAITSLITLTVLYIVTSLFNLLGDALHTLAVAKRLVKPYLRVTGVKYGDYLKATGTSRGDILRGAGITGGTWVQSVFFPIVYVVLMGAAFVGLVYLVNQLIVKKSKVDLQNVAKFGATMALPIGTALAVRFIRGFVHVAWINSTLLNGLYIAALLIALLQAFEIIREIIGDKKKYVFALCIMVFGIIVANYLIGSLFLGHFSAHFSGMPMLL